MSRLSPLGRLVFLGAVTEAAYIVVLVRPFSLARFVTMPELDLGKIMNFQPWQAPILAIGLFYLLYLLGYRTKGTAEMGKAAIAFGVLFAGTLVLVYPIGALDVFDYAFYGREIALYGANPYVANPQDFASDPFYPYMGWKGLPFTYGPVWAIASRLLIAANGDSLLRSVILFKMLAVALYAASCAIVYLLLRQKAPGYAFQGTLLFAWNPLVVSEVAVNGHNDIAIVFFLLLGLAAWAAQGKVTAIGSLALSVLTKFITAPLLPIWVIAGLKSRPQVSWRLWFLVASGLVVVALALSAYLPFLGDRTLARQVLLAPIQRDELFTSSLPTLLFFAIRDKVGAEPAQHLARNVAIGLLLVLTLYEMWAVKGHWQSVARASYNVLLGYLLFSCLWFQPWYVMWLVGLAVVLPPGRRSVTVVLFTMSALFKYVVYDFLSYERPDILDPTRIEVLSVAVIYILPLAYLLLSGLRQLGRVWPATSALLEDDR